MSIARERRVLAAIVVAAIALRFAFGAWVIGFGTAPKGDEADYHVIAANLLEGRGFTSFEGTVTARRPPAYPVFLALVYRVAGTDPAAGRVAQILLGGLVVWLCARVARRLFGPGVALLAAALAAANPFLIFISGYLLTENLYLVFLLGALALVPAPRSLGRGALRWAAAGGLLMGLATLARPTGLPMIEWMLAATLLLAASGWKARTARVALAATAFVLVLLPWYARNARAVGGWVLTTHGGITFYQGNNQKVVKVPQWRGGAAPLEALPHFDELVSMPEMQRDELSWRLGREYLRHQWRDVPSLVGWKLVRFWRMKSDMGLSGIRSGWWWSKDSTLGRLAAEVDVGLAYAACAIPLFALGLFTTRSRWRDLLYLYGVVVVHTAVAVVFFGSLRGRIPVEPVICMFAAAAAAGIRSRIRALRSGARTAPAP